MNQLEVGKVLVRMVGDLQDHVEEWMTLELEELELEAADKVLESP